MPLTDHASAAAERSFPSYRTCHCTAMRCLSISSEQELGLCTALIDGGPRWLIITIIIIMMIIIIITIIVIILIIIIMMMTIITIIMVLNDRMNVRSAPAPVDCPLGSPPQGVC